MKKVVIFSGYFVCAHRGHMEYAANARKLAGPNGLVYCIVNNDHQAIMKKGYSFVPEEDRVVLMASLKYVDKVFLSIDTDRTVCKTIQMICNTQEFKPTHFYNDGDVNPSNPCPEEPVCVTNNIELAYGTSDKVQSTTWILENSVKKAYDVMFNYKTISLD